ncbi:hypothetical protein Dsin_025797 [Dipteronia sinensis]|uniref:Uncharacterized protein n=1 Tax=Dipteronia sinensis TaxID=43782 RepID=A0AAD9ZX04_9ROSI|nr:hypothetical protein Dsin_025797 [Dipteronia sinensis]
MIKKDDETVIVANNGNNPLGWFLKLITQLFAKYMMYAFDTKYQTYVKFVDDWYCSPKRPNIPCSNPSISSPINKRQMVFQFARGLGNQYMDFRTAMLTKPSIPSFSQFVLSLQGHEQTLASQREDKKTYIEHNQAFFSERGRRGGNGRGAGGRV